jgi:hypothetical protein
VALGQEHWNVVPFVRVLANDLAKRYGARWNTYDGHGLPPGRGAAFTIDLWGPNGRGDPLDERKGDAIAAWVLGQHQVQPVRLLIWYSWWWRPGVGWKLYPGLHGNHGPGQDAHVHIGY